MTDLSECVNPLPTETGHRCPLCLRDQLTGDEKTACVESHGYTTLAVQERMNG